MKKNNEQKQCIVCCEDIKSSASYCIHCESTQNWTRYILPVSTTIGLFLAAGSLVSGAISLTELLPNPAQINAIALSCDKNSVELAISNTGDEPAIISKAWLTTNVDGNESESESIKLAVPKENWRVIKPGEAYSKKFLPYHRSGTEYGDLISGKFKSCTYSIKLEQESIENNSNSVVLVECECGKDV